MMAFPEEVVQAIKKHLPGFYAFLKSEEGKRWLEEREQRAKEFSGMLSKEALKKFTEADFMKIMEKLWANELWSNKQYPVERIFSSTKIEELRERLSDLLWSDKPFAQRYNEFMRNVKGMGPAQLTEILAFVNPAEYGIWNRRSRDALKILGFERIIPVNKYYISGDEYEHVNSY